MGIVAKVQAVKGRLTSESHSAAGSEATVPCGAEAEDEAPCDDWVCPLTHDVFTDPVTASDGHTYERSAITEWYRKKESSPMTK